MNTICEPDVIWPLCLAVEPVRYRGPGPRGGLQGGRGHQEGQPTPQGPGQAGNYWQQF